MILVLFENPSQRILPIYHVAAKAELARRGECQQCARPGVNARVTTDHHSITGSGADAAWGAALATE